MITIQVEGYGDCIEELKALYPSHHEELGLFKDKMPLDPDYPEYLRREQDGSLFLCTARNDGRIVAYYIAVVRPGFHYQSTLTGTADIYYVAPDFRGRGLALPLFRHVERELKRRGAKVWYGGNKIHNPLGADKLHELLGFIPADQYWAKWIG